MATLTAQATLTGSGLTSTALSITKNPVITISGAVTIQRKKLSTTASTLLVASAWTGSMVWIFNTEAAGGNAIKIVASEGGVTYFTILPGEWAFFPWESTADMLADASSGTPTVEVGIFQRDA